MVAVAVVAGVLTVAVDVWPLLSSAVWPLLSSQDWQLVILVVPFLVPPVFVTAVVVAWWQGFPIKGISVVSMIAVGGALQFVCLGGTGFLIVAAFSVGAVLLWHVAWDDGLRRLACWMMWGVVSLGLSATTTVPVTLWALGVFPPK